MTTDQRQDLILKIMKDKGIEVGSGVPDKKIWEWRILELIHIANWFQELREKSKVNN